MPMTTEALARARSWVGTEISDIDLSDKYDRLGTVDAAVEETLREQYTLLLETPSSVSLPSGLSVQNTQNITHLEKLLKDFMNSGGIDAELDGSSIAIPGIARLVRAERR